jgi:TPR repeat protein
MKRLYPIILLMLFTAGMARALSTPTDSLSIAERLHAAAAAGDPSAMNYLGYTLINSGDSAAIDEGFSWIKRAADAGSAKAAANIGYLIINDTTGRIAAQYERPDSTAAQYIRIGADAGLPHAKSLLADLYREGRGVPCDTLQAVSLYEEAANAGLADAEIRLINMMGRSWQKLPTDEALQLGEKYFNQRLPYAGVLLLQTAAKDEGMTGAHAKAILSDAYATARGTDYSYAETMRLLKESAKAGYQPAREKLSEIIQMFPDTLTDKEMEEIFPD